MVNSLYFTGQQGMKLLVGSAPAVTLTPRQECTSYLFSPRKRLVKSNTTFGPFIHKKFTYNFFTTILPRGTHVIIDIFLCCVITSCKWQLKSAQILKGVKNKEKITLATHLTHHFQNLAKLFNGGSISLLMVKAFPSPLF